VPPKTILVIEPDDAERNELTGVLQKIGYQVENAPNSPEGLRAFTEGRHDLVVVEVLIPGMNGLQVCKVVKEQGEGWDVKVVVVSKVYQSRAMAHDAIARYKADAYFSRPFPLVSLVEKINELIGEPETVEKLQARAARVARPEPESPAEKPAPPPKPAEPTFAFVDPSPLADEGEFDAEGLGRILAKLGREKVDCLLELTTEGRTKHVYFQEGRPVFVKSTIPEESLGRMLLADEVLTPDQYKDATVEMAETGKRFGTVIAAMGLVTSDELYYHLVNQTRRKIARCFAWSSGHFRVDRDGRYPAEATTFESEPAAVVLEGYREHLDSGPLEKTYEATKDLFVFPGDRAAAAAARSHLLPPERHLLEAADGKGRLGQIVGESELGLLPALRLVSSLVTLGALRLAQREKDPELAGYEYEPSPAPEAPEVDPRQSERQRVLKAFFVSMDDKDHFEMLGVSRDADETALHRALLARQKDFHPDTFTLSAPKRVRKMSVTVSRRLQQAYNALRDPESRRSYLEKLKAQAPRAAGQSAEAESDQPPDLEQRAALHYQDALISFERRNFVAAVQALKKAVADAPKNAEYRVKLAQAMFQFLDEPMFTWADVEAAAKQALILDKTRVDILELVGHVKGKLGDDETALAYFRKALELDPSNAELKRVVHYTEQRLKKEDDKGWSLFGKKS
jgi:CheY-like chemotaxis protein